MEHSGLRTVNFELVNGELTAWPGPRLTELYCRSLTSKKRILASLSMSEIVFRGTVVERGKSVLPGICIALGITALLFFLIGLIAGERAPSGMPEMIPYFGGSALLLLVFGLWKHYSVRGDLFVTKGKNNAMGITIMGRGKKKVAEFFTPFEVRIGFEQTNFGKGKRFNQLYMVIRDAQGNCLLSLESSLHGMYGVPDGWKARTREQMGEVTNEYMCSHMSELSKVLRSHIK